MVMQGSELAEGIAPVGRYDLEIEQDARLPVPPPVPARVGKHHSQRATRA